MAKRRVKNPRETGGQTSLTTWFIYTTLFAYISLIVVMFTPYTYNLDEIKVSILYCLGPILVCVYLFFAAQGKLRLLPPWLLIPVVGYSLVLLVSTLLAGKPYRWIGWIQQGFQFALLGGFLVGYGLMRKKKDVKRAVYFYMILGLATTIFGLFHRAGFFSILDGMVSEESSLKVLFFTFKQAQDQMFSTILNRQFYASFLVMLLPLTIVYAITENRNPMKRYIAIVTALFMIICLYLAYSKTGVGAFLATAVPFIILFKIFGHYKKLRIPHLGIWIAGFAMLALTLGYFTADQSMAQFKTFDTSVKSREIIWSGAVDMMVHGEGPDNWYELDGAPPVSPRSLLVGPGPGSFRLIFPRYRNADYHLHDISNVTLFAHNRYLDLLAENGILGFAAYMGIMLCFFILGVKRLVKCPDPDMRLYVIAYLCSILGILMTNVFSPNSRWPVVGTNLWCLLGLGFGVFETAREVRKKQETGKDPAEENDVPFQSTLRTPGPAAANAMLVLAILLLPAVFFSFRFGVRRFQGAKFNNEGLTLSKSGEHYTREMQKIAATLASQPKESEELRNYMKRLEAMRMRFYDGAIKSYQQALERNPCFITTYYKLAHAYNSILDLENSLETYYRLQQYAPDYSEIHYNLGVVSMSLANQLRRKMATASPEEAGALKKRIEELNELSLKEYKIASHMSTKEAVRKSYAQKLVTAGEMEKSLEVWEFLNERYPGKTEYLEPLAAISERLGRLEKAKNYYRELFRIDPSNSAYSRRLARIYRTSGESGEYEKFLKEVVGINPLDPQPRMSLVELYQSEDKDDDLQNQIRIMTRLPKLEERLSQNSFQSQNMLYQLAEIARALNDGEAESYFLKKCAAVNRDNALGEKSARRLKELEKS